MNIEQLTYIVEVAHLGSLAAAAKTLNISQSAISQAITKLEEELNITIFHRSRAGAVTTKEGDAMIEKAQDVLDAIYQMKEEAKNQANRANDYLRLSTIPGLAGPIIDTYLSFTKSANHLKIEVYEKSSMEIIKDVTNDHIDIGFIALNKTSTSVLKELEFHPLIKGQILIYTTKDSPLAKRKEKVTMELLQKQTFVLYKDEYVHNFVTHFQKRYGPLHVSFLTTNTDMITRAVTELGFVTIGHDVSIKFNANYPFDEMVALQIEDVFDTSFRFGWIKKKEVKLSEQAKRYVAEVNKRLGLTKK